MVAIPGRVSRCKFKLRSFEAFCADTRAWKIRRLLHGRQSGGLEYAHGRLEALRDGDVFRALDAAACASRGDPAPGSGRYDRAREFVDVVTGLWDSWADDAFVRDVERGIFFDPDKMHVLDHRGKHFSVRGPLNVARSVQGWPVIVQAGASEAGKQLAAETAEVIFGAANSMDEGRKFYADVKGRMARIDRDPEHLKIMPACFVVVGETDKAAQDKHARLDSLVHFDSAIASLSVALGCDASRFDPDAPLPPIPESNSSRTSRERAIRLAAHERMTVRQLAQRIGGYAGLTLVGTPKRVADEMQAWLEAGAADGFNVMFSDVPAGLDDFVDRVVPELQRRGIFRSDYEGNTLRENLGLPRPPNQFLPSSP